jgi:hypothetical protein
LLRILKSARALSCASVWSDSFWVHDVNRRSAISAIQWHMRSAGGWLMLLIGQGCVDVTLVKIAARNTVVSQEGRTQLWLSRRPGQVASAEQMHVQMKNRLPRAGTDVEDGAISVFDFALARDLRGG